MTVENTEFKVHLLNEDGIKKAKKLALMYDQFLTKLLKTIGGPSRELSIVKTKLEEASFFSKKCMASKEENQL